MKGFKYYCIDCNKQYVKWIGKCQCECTEILEIINDEEAFDEKDDIFEEIKCNLEEFSRVCTLVKKSLILIGGEPGIGKSTLMAQVANAIEGKALYLAGEESAGSVKKRFERVAQLKNTMVVSFLYIEKLDGLLKTIKPDLVILDSIYTVRFEDGKKDVILELTKFARKYNCCFLIVSHITKDGLIAGPKTIEHMVDVVLYMEGERYNAIRILRTLKNRFGSTAELGIFEMFESGLREVKNPSALLLSSKRDNVPGSVVYAGVSGKPFLMEIQALVAKSNFPVIETVGFDNKRTKMILAILNRWCKCDLTYSDVYVNCVGGIKISDPGADLAVAIAILSSMKNRSISPEVCFFGELGLTGEIRKVESDVLRIKEATRLGFKTIYCNSENGGKQITLLSKLCDML